MKVIIINSAANRKLAPFFIKIIEGIGDDTYDDAVINTSLVYESNKYEVLDLLRECYPEEDYDLFIYAADYTLDKDEIISDVTDIGEVNIEDICYLEPSENYDGYQNTRKFIMNNE